MDAPQCNYFSRFLGFLPAFTNAAFLRNAAGIFRFAIWITPPDYNQSMTTCTCGRECTGDARCAKCGAPMCAVCIAQSPDGNGTECQPKPLPGLPPDDVTNADLARPRGPK